ncbi:hypothetical protein P153DRAFT_350261 [Dothidotthia symphoricarpi CBS 119687]|uniref:Uncharacterized protein n=1 Tax=Dothidotthia symphoricarpi CBS 119687 TaxID=1392245 RepID=A0A6A6A160_9PLEO|nr:uncharacterized protein P153DRAFT_350261 [Dothidotthia symphoricarpi CBS 119687]KAF2124894.1 hypothetical protein P153DRAFT_350261 [Dothidotthia symphoricarpi CBS 119687]
MVEYIELEPLTKVKVRYHFPSMMPFVKGSSHMIYRFSSGVGYVVLGGISYVGPIIKGSGQLIYFFACKPGNVAHGGWIYMTNTISGLASKPYGVALAVLSYCKKPKDDIILIIEIISFIGSIILCAILCTQAMIFKSIIYQFQASIGHIWRTAFRISLPFAGIEAVVYAYILYNCYSVLGCAPTSGFPLFIYVFLSFIIGFCLIGSGYIKDPFEYTVPAGASYTQRKRWEEKEAQKTVGERVVDYVRWLFNLEYRSPVDDRR